MLSEIACRHSSIYIYVLIFTSVFISERNNNRSGGNTDEADTVTSEQDGSVRTNSQGLCYKHNCN